MASPLPNLLMLVGAALAAMHASARAEAPIDFTRDVLPILAEKCFTCHGPDASTRKANLRLDERTHALQAILPGDADNSLLLQRITHPDTAERMPPAAFPKQLDPTEVETLTQWIGQGARWAEHWAFQPLRQPDLPAIDDTQWPRNEIDYFVLRALQDRAMAPAPEADRRTLMRRLYFDLLGLPPDPAQVDAFVVSPDPMAYERLVDNLLDSPRYGERWARHWLDVAHYGETHGYDKDKRRPNAWPYRNYVIRALNDDKPYGQFVREQIAGDVLYPDDPQATVALGFVAAGPWDFVGHVELREGTTDKAITRNLDRDDMVATVMSSFQSLTVHCARCHDHKFDPIPQADYYALQAIFAGVDRADRDYDMDPAVHAKRYRLQHDLDHLEREHRQWSGRLEALVDPRLEALDASISLLRERITRLKQPQSPSNGYHSGIEPDPDHEKWVQVDLGTAQPIAKIRLVPARPTDFVETPGFGFPVRFHARASNDPEFKQFTTLADYSTTDFGGRTDQVVEFTPDAGHVEARYVRVTALQLWKRLDDYVFALAELEVLANGENRALQKDVSALDSIDEGRWHTRYLVDGFSSRERLGAPDNDEGTVAQVKLLEAELEALELEHLAIQRTLLAPHERVALDRSARELESTRRAIDALPAPAQVYAITSRFKSEGNFTPPERTREIFVLNRGDVNAPAAPAAPGPLSCIDTLPRSFSLDPDAGEGAARAALAQWITHHANPLTWRSIVNRVWHYHFGQGIVDTPNDFGRMGSPPTHPELLDWLAVSFLNNGESLKWLHRHIVTSATYRQASTNPSDFSGIDGGNQYLWRMERRQLDAEALRDATLVVSGKMDFTMAGPGFDTFEFIDDHSPRYLYERHDPADAAAFRRSIYRTVARSVPDPWMTTLDCADPSQSVPVRTQTITALQALALYNNPFVARQAAYMADRIAAQEQQLSEHLRLAWRLTTAREPAPAELALLLDYTNRHGLAAACRLILNANEFMFID